jgi:hypothetical protein
MTNLAMELSQKIVPGMAQRTILWLLHVNATRNTHHAEGLVNPKVLFKKRDFYFINIAKIGKNRQKRGCFDFF